MLDEITIKLPVTDKVGLSKLIKSLIKLQVTENQKLSATQITVMKVKAQESSHKMWLYYR